MDDYGNYQNYENREGEQTEPAGADETAAPAKTAETATIPRRRRRGGAVKGETRREKFVRLSELRTNKVLDALRILGNCSNRATNEYTENDVEQIFGAIEEALQETREKFLIPEKKKSDKFRLNPR